jgi:HK97 family phage major capsid protein
MPQTTGTGALAQAQNTIIEQMLYTEEHNAPAMSLITQMNLKKGASTVDVPKAGAVDMADLVDGQDIIDEEDMGISFTTLTSSEVGAKIIITDKLLRQMQHDVYKIVGKQMGEGMARKKDNDVTALYTSFSQGLGAAASLFTIDNAAIAYSFALANTVRQQGRHS